MAARNNMAGGKASSSANARSGKDGEVDKDGKGIVERKNSEDTLETRPRDTTITVYLSNEIPVTMVQFEPILEILGEKHPAL